MELLLLLIVGWAAVDAFGWLHGLGIAAAVILLAPHSVVILKGEKEKPNG